jgi:hypothetical protein
MGRTCPGNSLGMAALEGYATAIEVLMLRTLSAPTISLAPLDV